MQGRHHQLVESVNHVPEPGRGSTDPDPEPPNRKSAPRLVRSESFQTNVRALHLVQVSMCVGGGGPVRRPSDSELVPVNSLQRLLLSPERTSL